jgi:hypothetical protein
LAGNYSRPVLGWIERRGGDRKGFVAACRPVHGAMRRVLWGGCSVSTELRLELEANLLEQRGGENASGTDNHGVIPDLPNLAAVLDRGGFLLDRDDAGFEQHPQPTSVTSVSGCFVSAMAASNARSPPPTTITDWPPAAIASMNPSNPRVRPREARAGPTGGYQVGVDMSLPTQLVS